MFNYIDNMGTFNIEFCYFYIKNIIHYLVKHGHVCLM